MLKLGDKMPSFEVVDQDGNKITSSELKGKKTIIYFYPKDNTPGCTAEACNLRDNYEALVDVFGKFAVIYNRKMGLLVAIEPDMAYLCHRNQGQQSVHHSESCPEYGHDCEFAA